MRKNANFITLAPSLIKKMISFMENTGNPQEEEFRTGLEELVNGECITLMLSCSFEEKDEAGETEEEGYRPREEGLHFKDLSVYPRSRKVLYKNTEISLTPKEFEILYFLMENKGEVFTKEQIYQAVWAEDYLMADSNIMAFIRKLRKKIEPNPDAPEYILTIWGVGYKFNDRK